MKIEIKERKLTAGNRSLYLEYYETGFRKKRICICILYLKIHQRQES